MCLRSLITMLAQSLQRAHVIIGVYIDTGIGLYGTEVYSPCAAMVQGVVAATVVVAILLTLQLPGGEQIIEYCTYNSLSAAGYIIYALKIAKID